MVHPVKEHELLSPVDLPGEPIEGRHPLRWTAVTLAVAALVLLFANAATLSAWVDEKPVSETQQQLSVAAGSWAGVMDSIGVTAPRAKLHALWKTLQAARFGDEAPGDTV